MKLSLETEYALLALIYLSRHNNGDWVKTEDIAQDQEIPKKFLEQILLTLKKNGYLKSKRGYNGGYMLLKSPDEIRIVDVIRLISGPIASTSSASEYFYESTPIEKNTALLKLFKEIRDYVNTKLENTTFADLT